MGLSNERQPDTATIEAYRDQLARIAATNLADRLIRFERNPDAREAENPAHSVTRIRVLRPIVRVQVTDDVKDHNTSVSNLGGNAEWGNLWR
jgi:hypothetical protein